MLTWLPNVNCSVLCHLLENFRPKRFFMIALPSVTSPPSASVLFSPIAYRYVASYRKADSMGAWRVSRIK